MSAIGGTSRLAKKLMTRLGTKLTNKFGTNLTNRLGTNLTMRAVIVFLACASALGISALAGAAAFPALLRIPPRQARASAAGVPAALFSHRGHQSFGCYACHPALFPQAPLGFTHEQMRGGQFCGRCHQGRIAFAIEGATCGGCHAPTP